MMTWIRWVFVSVAFLGLTQMAFALPDEWKSCHRKSDCMALANVCGEPMAVNKRFYTDFGRWKKQQSKENCEDRHWPKVVNLNCHKHVCQAAGDPDMLEILEKLREEGQY